MESLIPMNVKLKLKLLDVLNIRGDCRKDKAGFRRNGWWKHWYGV